MGCSRLSLMKISVNGADLCQLVLVSETIRFNFGRSNHVVIATLLAPADKSRLFDKLHEVCH